MIRVLAASAVISFVCAIQRVHLGLHLSDAEMHSLFLADLQKVLTGTGKSGAPETAAHNMTRAFVSGIADITAQPEESASTVSDPGQRVVTEMRTLLASEAWNNFLKTWETYMEDKGLNSLSVSTTFGWYADFLGPYGRPRSAVVSPLGYLTFTLCILPSCRRSNAAADQQTEVCFTPAAALRVAPRKLAVAELMWNFQDVLNAFKATLYKTPLKGEFWKASGHVLYTLWGGTTLLSVVPFNHLQDLDGAAFVANSLRMGVNTLDFTFTMPDAAPGKPWSLYGDVRTLADKASSSVYWNLNRTSNLPYPVGMDWVLGEGPTNTDGPDGFGGFMRLMATRTYYGGAICSRGLIGEMWTYLKSKVGGMEEVNTTVVGGPPDAAGSAGG